MRDLDKRAILTNDFIVLYGDVVSNVPLGPAMAAHRARRAIDKNAIMTMVLREAGAHHRTKANDLLAAFVIDPNKRRCLHYQQLTAESDGLLLDEDTLKQDVDLRTDLIDCGIDICTPDVLALWSDNFDYEKPRAGFLHSVLKDYELNGKTIHTHIVDDCYAARVRNLQGYDSVSKDILEGWPSPYVPANNWVDNSKYEQSTPGVFKETGARISRTARLGPHAVIGANSRVGSATIVRQSVVGKGCSIGSDCILDGAYIWDNATVEDGCNINTAIIASGSTVGSNSQVTDGPLISYNVSVPSKTTLGKRKRVVAKSSSAITQLADTFDVLTPDAHDSEDAAGLNATLYNLLLTGSQESISTLASNMSDTSGSDIRIHRASFTSQDSTSSPLPRGADDFVAINASSIVDSLKQGHDVFTIQLELQSQRMAQNASEHQVRQAVATALNRYVFETAQKGPKVVELVQQLKTMFERIVFDSTETQKPDQVDFLLLCQSEATKKDGGAEIFGNICNGLYTVDDWEQDGTFSGEAFEQWWNDDRSQESEELRRMRGRLKKFIEIVTAEEDEDDE